MLLPISLVVHDVADFFLQSKIVFETAVDVAATLSPLAYSAYCTLGHVELSADRPLV